MNKSGLIGIPHDYIFEIAGVTFPGGAANPNALQALEVRNGTGFVLDRDAPFSLRSIHQATNAATTGFSMRYTRPDGSYANQYEIPSAAIAAGSIGMPVAPEMDYDAGTMMRIDLTETSNTGGGVLLIFRGVKWFAPGAIQNYRPADSFRAFFHCYTGLFQVPSFVGAGATLNIGFASNRSIRTDFDADFCWRWLTVRSVGAIAADDFRIRPRHPFGRYLSSGPDVGGLSRQGYEPIGVAGYDQSQEDFPWPLPRTIVPDIVYPAGVEIQFDLQNYSPLAAAGGATYQLVFGGEKRFRVGVSAKHDARGS